MEIWIYRIASLIALGLGTYFLLEPLPSIPDAPPEFARSNLALTWSLLVGGAFLGVFSLHRAWLPVLDRLLWWVGLIPLALVGGGLVYSFISHDGETAVMCLVVGTLYIWNLTQVRSGNALPALGRVLFLLCCIASGFFTTLFLIGVGQGYALASIHFAVIAAIIFAIGWSLRYALVRTD